MQFLSIALAIILIVAGMAGIIMPVLPGTVLIFLGMFLYGYATGFAAVDTRFLLLMLLLTAAGTGLDYVTAAVGARKYGASRAGVLGALIGGIAGIFILSPFGIFLGPFAGAFLGEFLAGKKTADQAARAGVGTILGIITGVVLKMMLAVAMLALFIARVRA